MSADFWSNPLPEGVTEIRSPIHVPPGKTIRGRGRTSILRSFVPAGSFAINFEGTQPFTGGGATDLTVEVATKGAGGIRAIECHSLLLSNLLIRSVKVPVRQASVGILLDGRSAGSSYCRLDFIDVFLCETGLQLDTTVNPIAFSNRHSMTGLRFWQCALGIDFAASSTNWIQVATESCDRPMRFKMRSRRNFIHLIDEQSKLPITIEAGAVGNELSGIYKTPVNVPISRETAGVNGN